MTKMEKFAPIRNNVNVAKSPTLKVLGQHLSNLDINKHTLLSTPPYDPLKLAEVLIVNLLESKYEDLLTFKEYLGVFSLEDEISESIYNFVVLNHIEIMSLSGSLEGCDLYQYNCAELVDENIDSESNDSADGVREERMHYYTEAAFWHFIASFEHYIG